MIGAVLAMALSLAVQDPPAAPPPADPGEVAIEGIVVDGRPLEQAVREFVGEVAGPPRGRGLAQWRGRLCLGVANLAAEPAQALIDRIGDVAAELEIEIGEPGCAANALIIFSADADAMADALIDEDRRIFRTGVGGFELGSAALERFRTTDAPVRWWQISVPTDSETGERAVRLPGDINPATGQPSAPTQTVAASRLTSQIRDDLNRTIVIVDIDQVANVSFEQLADYLALVTLAQIDPEGDPAGFTTVLNVFDDPAVTPGLSDWDWSYLRALYSSRPMRHNAGSQASDLASFMARERRAEPVED